MQQNIFQLETTQASSTIVPNQLKTTVCLDWGISYLTNHMGTIRICGFFFPIYGAWNHRKRACWPLRFVLLYLGYYSAISMLWAVNTSALSIILLTWTFIFSYIYETWVSTFMQDESTATIIVHTRNKYSIIFCNDTGHPAVDQTF